MRKTRQRKDDHSASPDVFDDEAIKNSNQALRSALFVLRYYERHHGPRHETVASALLAVADLCFTFRIREPCERHSATAIRVLTSIFGPDHPRTEQAKSVHSWAAGNTTEALAVPLDEDVQEGLSRHGRELRCERQGCEQHESEGVRFRACAAWCNSHI